MVLSLTAEQSEIDGILAAAKDSLGAAYPMLEKLRSLKLENAVGVRVEIDAPTIGLVEAVVRLEVRDGAAFPGGGSG